MIMKRLIIIFCTFFLLVSQAVSAMDVDSLKVVADNAYAKEDFHRAAKLYLRITQMGESSVVCYNLGNCYYRMDDLAHSILWYERALLLSPGDEDIRFNLDPIWVKCLRRWRRAAPSTAACRWRTPRRAWSVIRWTCSWSGRT